MAGLRQALAACQKVLEQRQEELKQAEAENVELQRQVAAGEAAE